MGERKKAMGGRQGNAGDGKEPSPEKFERASGSVQVPSLLDVAQGGQACALLPSGALSLLDLQGPADQAGRGLYIFSPKSWIYMNNEHPWKMDILPYCPQSFSGGGLYLNGSWLLWSVNDGLQGLCIMGYYGACIVGY